MDDQGNVSILLPLPQRYKRQQSSPSRCWTWKQGIFETDCLWGQNMILWVLVLDIESTLPKQRCDLCGQDRLTLCPYIIPSPFLHILNMLIDTRSLV